MIYETPLFSPGGDRHISIEFGNEMNMDLNFISQNLGKTLLNNKVKGVIETAPCFASLLVHYEPEEITYDDLKSEIKKLFLSLGPSDDIELKSRLFYFPTVYLDPWTKECVEDYCSKISPKEPDPEFITKLNHLEDVHQFVRVHSGTEYWVSALGFWPGLPFMMPLDPRCKITAPKYNPPRMWTPEGTIGMGGASTAIYPAHLPGGYQIFGRTPVPIWNTKKSFDVFENSICLFQPGDRVKFVPCTVEEFEHIEAKVKEKTYIYNLVEYQKFSVAEYKKWIKNLDLNKKF